MKFLIDTCVISELAARKPSDSVRRWFAEHSDLDMFLSVVTVGELHKGIERLQNDDARRVKLERWLDLVKLVFAGRILPFVETTAVEWGRIVGASIRTGKVRPAIDSQIAATALVNDMVLVTRNVSDFIGAGVRLVNPFTDA